MIRRWLRRALRIHSPSGHALGTCWCKPESPAKAFVREVEARQAMIENGLCGSGTSGCHWRTEQARDLSYACGWLLRKGTDPAATPALILTVLGSGWHVMGDDVRLAEPEEIPPGMWPSDFWAARARLLDLTAGSAA